MSSSNISRNSNSNSDSDNGGLTSHSNHNLPMQLDLLITLSSRIILHEYTCTHIDTLPLRGPRVRSSPTRNTRNARKLKSMPKNTCLCILPSPSSCGWGRAFVWRALGAGSHLYRFSLILIDFQLFSRIFDDFHSENR